MKKIITESEKERIIKLHINEGYNTLLEHTTPFKNNDEGNKFRAWFNQKFPDLAKQLKLDEVGTESNSYNNYFINRAYNYKVGNNTIGNLYTNVINKNFIPDFFNTNLQTTTTATPTTSEIPFRSNDEGNKFRKWVKENYPKVSTTYNLTEVGADTNSFKNGTIKLVWNYKVDGETLGQKYIAAQTKKANTPKPQDSLFVSALRSVVPNYAQLKFSRELTTSDFTDKQKATIYETILNSIKRTGQKNKACTEYIDYSQNIHDLLAAGKGKYISTIQALWGTFTDVKFVLATLLGRFCWKLNTDGTYTITDEYDFARPETLPELKKYEKKDLKGMSVDDLMKKFDTSLYGAERIKAWVDFPTDGYKIEIKIDPKELVDKVSGFRSVFGSSGAKF